MAQKSESFWQRAAREFVRDGLGMFGFGVVLLLFIISFLAPLIANDRPVAMQYDGEWYFPAIVQTVSFGFLGNYEFYRYTDPHDFYEANVDDIGYYLLPPVPWAENTMDWENVLAPPSNYHPFGTDELGRDILARMVHGADVSLKVGFISTGIALIIGLFLGSLAGYYGGWVDVVIMRIIEVFMCFPTLLLILSILAFVQPSIWKIMVVIGLVSWTGYARMVRGEFFRLKEREYTTAARALGARDWRVIFRHILPNALAPILVMASFGVATAINVEASLSYLGFGIQPPEPSWGGIMSKARENIEIAYWLALFPGVAIFLGVLGYTLVGEGLRDAIDPRTSNSRRG